jgi:ubiquinone/menaquinone biosynthesis C-methylase UbiE
MDQKYSRSDYSEIAQSEKRQERKQHHRGNSTESLLDKDAILSGLGIGIGQVVLDAGCGNGYMSKEFLRLVGSAGKVYAVDTDKTAITALREGMEGTNLVAMVGDITTTTDLPASAFDLIYLSTVFHGFSPEQIKGFEKEVKRLLAPRGKLALVEIVKRVTPFGPPLSRRFSPEELKHALGLTPLVTVEVGEYFYMQTFENRK